MEIPDWLVAMAATHDDAPRERARRQGWEGRRSKNWRLVGNCGDKNPIDVVREQR